MAPQEKETSSKPRLATAVFGLTIFLGAFLLFQSQPLVSKAILPWFGGCPAVWTTCMLFFQTLLFGGYLYAHLLQNRLTPRGQILVHLAVVAAAIAVLPIVPGEAWKSTDGANPAWRILWLLTCTVGLPYFAVSATSPLVQTWFHGVFPDRSPYRLYALSNAGSLAALLSYPFLFEPAFALPMQSRLWSVSFAAYAVLCAACLWPLRRGKGSPLKKGATAGLPSSAWEIPRNNTAGQASSGTHEAPTWFDRFCWLALPACASLMLLAATNHICQDVAVVPFLWVVPLALYLLSFILCFDHARWYIRWLWSAATVIGLVGVTANDYVKISTSYLSLMPELALYLSTLFFACMMCHGELARRKPAARYLTEFYLLISVGGALGGLFVALVAPLIFSTYFEWQIGVIACFLLAVGLLLSPGVKYAFKGTVLFSLERNMEQSATQRLIRLACFSAIALAVGCVLSFVVCYLAFWETGAAGALARTRNFFGTVYVERVDSDGAPYEYRLRNGRITHGRQFADPAWADIPTSYYGEQSGVGLAIRRLQLERPAKPIRIGAIGLGVGTVAAYLRPDDAIRFYEINPEVERLARRYFTYLSGCRGRSEVILGDARLSLESEPPQQFDVLVVDAFSGDSIPVHLMTREALAVFRRHMAPHGIVAFHVSNNYLRLAPVVRRLADDCRWHAVLIDNREDEDRLVHSSTWVLAAESEKQLQSYFPTAEPWAPEDMHGPLWTDQYSNLFQILEWR